jgi:four helix bundle protein
MAAPKHRELKVWQSGTALAVETYRITRSWPDSERFELGRQARRAAVSIPANIAEGHGRIHAGDFFHHVAIARGSLMELDTHFVLANQLGYSTDADLSRARELIDATGRMLTRLAQKLRPVKDW